MGGATEEKIICWYLDIIVRRTLEVSEADAISPEVVLFSRGILPSATSTISAKL